MFVDYGISSNSIDNNYLKNDYNLKTNDNLINISSNSDLPIEFATVTKLNKPNLDYGNDLVSNNKILYQNSKSQIINNYERNNLNYLNNTKIIQPDNNALIFQNQNQNPNIINAQNNNVLINKQNNNALVTYQNDNTITNNQNNNRTNKSNGLQSNDFWQKIDRRKHLNSNNNSENSIVSQNRRNNRNNDSDQMNQFLDDFFGDFFNNEGHHQMNSNQVQIRMGHPQM